jgi:hypothetical protein
MAVMANSMEIPQKIKIELPYDSAIPLLNIYIYIYISKEDKINMPKTYCALFITAIFIVVKIWNQPKCPLSDEWMTEM